MTTNDTPPMGEPNQDHPVVLTLEPQTPEPGPGAHQSIEPQRFPDAGFDFNLSPTASAQVIIRSRDGKGWTMQDYKRLVAILELQRSFLADEPIDVSVRVTTPPEPRPIPATAQLAAPQD